MQELDPRIIQIAIEVNGQIKTYSGDLMISATGTKIANSLQNECEVTLYNLDRATQDYILTQTSPYNRNRSFKTLTLYAGRKSYGVSKIYQGTIITSSITQPPDIGITLKCLTGNYLKGLVLSRSYAGAVSFQQVASQLASSANLALNFQASDIQLGNYAYTGSALKQVDQLNTVPNTNTYIDDDSLVVKNAFVPLTGTLRVLNADSGMIGIPVFTEQGLKVKFLLDNKTRLGGALEIQSRLYPATNGIYVIYKLGFEISSRDTPFYWIAECARRLQSR